MIKPLRFWRTRPTSPSLVVYREQVAPTGAINLISARQPVPTTLRSPFLRYPSALILRTTGIPRLRKPLAANLAISCGVPGTSCPVKGEQMGYPSGNITLSFCAIFASLSFQYDFTNKRGTSQQTLGACGLPSVSLMTGPLSLPTLLC